MRSNPIPLKSSSMCKPYNLGMMVGQAVINYLNNAGLPVHGSACTNIPGTDQRDAMIYASNVDLEEAYLVGRKAVEIAARDGSGYMGNDPAPTGRSIHCEFR